MKKYFIFFILFSLFSFASASTNTGIIPGQIWYSKEPLVEGETVKIYTLVWNADTNPLTARIEFYDKNVVLGSRDIVVDPEHSKDVSVSWKVTAGDHLISAKIISSSITSSGKKQNILLENNATEADKQFVSVLIKNANGSPASTSDVLKNELNKASSAVDVALPNSIGASVSSLDSFRENQAHNVGVSIAETQKQIDKINLSKDMVKSATASKTDTKNKTLPQVKSQEAKPLDGTEKPIAYVRLFFLLILSFILGNKFVFYGLITLVLFLVIRFIYRKIKNR
jgi:hypothetical protein